MRQVIYRIVEVPIAQRDRATLDGRVIRLSLDRLLELRNERRLEDLFRDGRKVRRSPDMQIRKTHALSLWEDGL